jgi:hypothetical protein
VKQYEEANASKILFVLIDLFLILANAHMPSTLVIASGVQRRELVLTKMIIAGMF